MTVLIVITMISNMLRAQSSDPSLISSGGDLGIAGSFTLSYSIGEPCISSVQNGENWVTEGFQQPGKINLTSIEQNAIRQNAIFLNPNPVSNELHISSTDLVLWRSFQITNVLGQIMPVPSIVSEQSVLVDVHLLKPGLYYLIVQSNESLRTQSFIKI